MAEFWIVGKRFIPGSKKIGSVGIFKSEGKKLVDFEIISSAEVVRRLENKHLFITATSEDGENYKPGAEVEYYLRTHRNGTPNDNLDNLPDC